MSDSLYLSDEGDRVTGHDELSRPSEQEGVLKLMQSSAQKFLSCQVIT